MGLTVQTSLKVSGDNRALLEQWERESGYRAKLEAQRAEASEAIRRANEVLRVHRGADARIETVIRRICRVAKLSPAHLMSESRSSPVVFARQAVCYWARRLSKFSYPRIGEELGNRDHTTVLHGCIAYREKRAAMGRHLRATR